MKKITIAIDGYSSTGKSTVAKELANSLGYVYVDTGAMYRAITLYAFKENLFVNNIIDKNTLVSKLSSINLDFNYNSESNNSNIFLNGKNVEGEIRTLQISNKVSELASIKEVRAFLVDKQRAYGENGGVVMDGRDIGTVVFKDAELKLFMTASPEIRAKRRYDELLTSDDKVTYEEVLENLTKRDFLDTTRQDSPLVIADDAVEIDNSYLTRQEQFSIILDLVKERS